MYTLEHIIKEGLNFIELRHSKGHTEVVICPSEGGRLNHLIVENICVIKATHPNDYKTNYASAILFPFANRIKNGDYSFNDLNYKLNCNEVKANNALHGLVYNKRFELIDSTLTEAFASVTLRYSEVNDSTGFPFKYTIDLMYTLDKNGISLIVNVLNTDTKAFPFTLGWHPYFETKDLYHSYLKIRDHEQSLQEIKATAFQFKDKKFDDGFELEDNQIEFITPEYQIQLTSTSSENYLQLYTPENSSCVAIEPMTGAVDSFNNGKGLLVLQPNEIYEVEWVVRVKKLETNINIKNTTS